MAAAVAKHETRALLRAHLAAATRYRHRTEHCPICRRLLLLAMQPERDPLEPPESPAEDRPESGDPGGPGGGESPTGGPDTPTRSDSGQKSP